MNRMVGVSPDFRRRFALHVLVPLSGLLVAITAALTFVVVSTTTRTDTDSINEERAIIQVAIAGSLRDLGAQQRSVALSRPVARAAADASLDAAWLNENVGTWLHDMFRHDRVFIVDGSGEALYAAIQGAQVAATRYGDLGAYLRNTVAEVGASGEQHVGLLRFGAQPAAVAVARIGHVDLPGRPGHDNADRPSRLLVNLKMLDDGYLADLSRDSMLSDLRFSAVDDASDAERSIALRQASGESIGYLVWRPDLPGTKMRAAIMPFMLAVLAVLVLAMGLLARRLWKSALRLSQSVIELRASEAQAQHLAFHDVLTGLPNRALFDQRLAEALAATQPGERVGLLLLDLDRFKQVNDTLGHHAGDAYLKQAAMRLSALARPGDTVARLGGDEFVLIRPGMAERTDAEDLACAVAAAIRKPFHLRGNEIFGSTSIGIAVAPDDAQDRVDLMRRADIAMYAAKREGRDRFRCFEPDMDETVKKRQVIADELRIALLDAKGLDVHYQPQVNPSGAIVGLEALVRWTHPVRGAITPDEFIPVAEETGLIVPLGEWILRQACGTARQWPGLFMAVNLSPVQLRSPDFALRAIEIVEAGHCNPSQIELEVTEGILVGDDPVSNLALARLRRAGFKVALDDFGTGYSSLSYLRRFEVDKIKIDRSFTQNLCSDANSAAIVGSVVALGRAMGITVTAEGVETTHQMTALVDAGCDELQGFLFSRAVPASCLAALFKEREVALAASLP
ncbi:bifunctional diguanylate cyclase/phosphodiesterase [Pigmentiphaga litoralis]|nr:bifunctional diguanylate cyclase/phosphodiesterase [Pigmentiphaga litoralis]